MLKMLVKLIFEKIDFLRLLGSYYHFLMAITLINIIVLMNDFLI